MHDSFISKHKISALDYDWSSRLEGYSIEKPDGIFRILVLADSIAYGQGVKRNETFSKQIENLLNGDSKKKKFEVVNTGFCGIDKT